jgi:hypothetical protein
MEVFIYLFVGIGLGMLFALNYREFREMKTYEQLDEELRRELEFNKNTVKSQQIDVDFYRQKAKFWKEKYESIPKQLP